MQEQRRILADTVTRSPEATIELGRRLAPELSPPCLVLLEGELGAGKTTLIKGLVAGFGAASEEEVSSPSFTLVHEYGSPPHKVYHADLYRVEGPQDLATLGLEDLADQGATLIVEWGGKLGTSGLSADVRIELAHVSPEERHIKAERLKSFRQG